MAIIWLTAGFIGWVIVCYIFFKQWIKDGVKETINVGLILLGIIAATAALVYCLTFGPIAFFVSIYMLYDKEITSILKYKPFKEK